MIITNLVSFYRRFLILDHTCVGYVTLKTINIAWFTNTASPCITTNTLSTACHYSQRILTYSQKGCMLMLNYVFVEVITTVNPYFLCVLIKSCYFKYIILNSFGLLHIQRFTVEIIPDISGRKNTHFLFFLIIWHTSQRYHMRVIVQPLCKSFGRRIKKSEISLTIITTQQIWRLPSISTLIFQQESCVKNKNLIIMQRTTFTQ